MAIYILVKHCSTLYHVGVALCQLKVATRLYTVFFVWKNEIGVIRLDIQRDNSDIPNDDLEIL